MMARFDTGAGLFLMLAKHKFERTKRLPLGLSKVKLPLIYCSAFIVALLAFDRPVITFVCLKNGIGLKAEEERIKNTLKLYNACFQDFYASGGLHAKLDEFPAVKPIKHELFRDIGFLTDNQRVMVYDSADQKIQKLTLLAPGKAEVEVLEEWNYLYQKSVDRKPFTKVRGFGQGFRYRLQQVKGRWLVTEWEPFDAKEPVNQNEFYF